VSADGRTALAAWLGVLMLRLVTSGGYRAYVRPRMGLLLLLAGSTLTGAALVPLLSLFRSALPPRVDTAGNGLAGSGHRHRRARRLDLLLLVPIVLIGVLPPVPLGAAAAAMRAGARMAAATSAFPSLPRPVTGAVPLTVADFVGRALYDVDGSLRGIRVRLVGLVAPDPRAPPGGFLLVRSAMFCCAADAVPMRIHVRGDGSRPPPEDAWVEVMGTWQPAPPRPASRFDPSMMPTLAAISVRSVPEPSDPYDPPF
jgi:uncharacterized repeat protein (TIGR03943 family)